MLSCSAPVLAVHACAVDWQAGRRSSIDLPAGCPLALPSSPSAAPTDRAAARRSRRPVFGRPVPPRLSCPQAARERSAGGAPLVSAKPSPRRGGPDCVPPVPSATFVDVDVFGGAAFPESLGRSPL